jgi:hypothetical protein
MCCGPRRHTNWHNLFARCSGARDRPRILLELTRISAALA